MFKTLLDMNNCSMPMSKMWADYNFQIVRRRGEVTGKKRKRQYSWNNY